MLKRSFMGPCDDVTYHLKTNGHNTTMTIWLDDDNSIYSNIFEQFINIRMYHY